jgi:nitroimidazol reductase NimA-like FMN-containing flavoprotein (pyridoxamine 5'-phosphate oxidase superfamily)
VCFEVDVIFDVVNWKSVITWGTFEELKSNEERQKALKILTDRSLPLMPPERIERSHQYIFSDDDINDIEGVFYRIKLKEKNGRFENSIQSKVD